MKAERVPRLLTLNNRLFWIGEPAAMKRKGPKEMTTSLKKDEIL